MALLKVPSIDLVGDIAISPTDYLAAKLPALEKSIDRRALQSSQAAIAFLQQKTQTLQAYALLFFSTDELLRAFLQRVSGGLDARV